MADAGAKDFQLSEIAAPSRGSRFSRRASRQHREIRAHGTVGLPLLAPRGGWQVVLHGSGDHFNCAVGAYTHNISLSSAREKETEQTLKMMFDLGYVKPEEVPQIPRLPKTPAVIAYAPLGDAKFAPDSVLFSCKPAGAMLLNEAVARAGIGSGAPD